MIYNGGRQRPNGGYRPATRTHAVEAPTKGKPVGFGNLPVARPVPIKKPFVDTRKPNHGNAAPTGGRSITAKQIKSIIQQRNSGVIH